MKKCTNLKYISEIPDGCSREIIKGCDDCDYYKEEVLIYKPGICELE